MTNKINWQELPIVDENSVFIGTLGKMVESKDFEIDNFEIDPITGGIKDFETQGDSDIEWDGFTEAFSAEHNTVFFTSRSAILN